MGLACGWRRNVSVDVKHNRYIRETTPLQGLINFVETHERKLDKMKSENRLEISPYLFVCEL